MTCRIDFALYLLQLNFAVLDIMIQLLNTGTQARELLVRQSPLLIEGHCYLSKLVEQMLALL